MSDRKKPGRGLQQHDEAGTLSTQLLPQILELIESARGRAAAAVNAELTMLYWRIGLLLKEHVVRGDRAEYGQQIIERLAADLTEQYGKGWSHQQLRHCLRTAETFPDAYSEILYTLCRELSWSHIRKLVYIDEPLKREFYTEMARLERWSVRQLNDRIRSMLYERTAISKKPEETISGDLQALRQEGRVSADLAFRDPYVLDFLGLADTYSEHDLESAILAELQRFISELGTDFAFVARQKRITIDQRDYYIDLLFFHRRLKALVAIDLKIGEFEAAFKGQMELYLRYLEKHDMVEGEQPPIGLILCTGKNEEHVELLQLHQANIRVAEYLTELPSRELLRQKLHESIARARHKLLPQSDDSDD
jgi:predicted nuclease of restriction endonuclease-like (RecB) superfamily